MTSDSDNLPTGPSETIAYGNEGQSARPSADLTGRVLADRYRIMHQLGAGGMGTVYLAEHTTIGKRFAVKVLSTEFSRKQEAVDRFLREAKTSSRIEHPNVVEINDFGFTEQQIPYFVMELLEGEELADAVEREGALPWPRVRDVMIQILTALEAAHAVGVVHRDMKPQNCFLVRKPNGEEVVKVLDFGIAKVIDDDPEFKTMTQTGVVVGTVHYMSPEQAQSERVDARSDIYSAGVVAYKLLTGYVPYDATGVVGVLSKLLTGEFPAMRETAPDVFVHPRVEALVRKAMAKDREDRFASAAEFADALRELPDELPSPEDPAAFAGLEAASLAPVDMGPISASQVTAQPRLDIEAIRPEPVRATATASPAPRREEGSFVGRLALLGVLGVGVIAGIYFAPKLLGALTRADADAETSGLADSAPVTGAKRDEPPAKLSARSLQDRYAEHLAEAVATHSIDIPISRLLEPNALFHTVSRSSPKTLAPSKSLREGPLQLSVRVETLDTERRGMRSKTKHTLLTIQNRGQVPVAYHVELRKAGGGECKSPALIEYDALVLDPDQKVKISVCPGRQSVELLDLRALEITALGAAWIRKLPPQAVGLSGSAARAHDPGPKVDVCQNHSGESARALEDGTHEWQDIVDFYSRHDCTHYRWWPGYKHLTAGLDALPALPDTAPALPKD